MTHYNTLTNLPSYAQKILYGNKIQPLSTSQSSFTHELYRSSSSKTTEASNNLDMSRPLPPNPKKGVIKVEQKSNPQFLAMLGAKSLAIKTPSPTLAAKTTQKPTSTTNTKTPSLTPGSDAALAQLQISMASENAKKAGNTYDGYCRS
jgi:RNA polymerase II elongation factor ELL